jgi:U3 small nucleolar RNA-associated protein 3
MDSEDEFLEGREKVLLDEGPTRKRVRQAREEEELLDASDEEVLAVPDSDEYDSEGEEMGEVEMAADEEDEDLEITGKKRRREEDEDEEGWGTSRKDLYGDDELETEEAALAHEAEGRRIQQKQLEEMNDEDFGFGDQEWGAVDAKADEHLAMEGTEDHFLERLPEATIADDATPEERTKVLRERYPEFEPLKREFIQLQETYNELKDAATEEPNPIIIIKYQALASYLGILSMYFAILTSTATENGQAFAKAPIQLRDHEVMQGLIQARTTWTAAQDLEEPESLSEEESSDSEEMVQVMEIPKTSRLLQKKKKKAQPPSAAEIALIASEARRAARLAAVEADFADLDNLPARSSLKKSSQKQVVTAANDDDSDLGDETELNAYEAAAKAAKRKSLRFYTSEIAQKANKRSARGREVGGDTDIPVRERWRDRQMRMQAEAARRKEVVAELRHGDGATTEKPRRKQAKEFNEDGDDDEYQNLLLRAQKVKANKKASATEHYTTHSAAVDAGYLAADGAIGADGKRKITYQIEKNKGLAPHRKKDVRNPRVKKRNKYEEKKKKLNSTKAVYKGGPGKGGYQGELTGIKTGLVKSVKLS